jgi:peroxiredoxin
MFNKINRLLDNPRVLQASILFLTALLAVLVVQNQKKLQEQTFSSDFPTEEIIIGRKIQPVTLETIDGTSYNTGDLGGDYKLLIFFATNCPYCAKDISLWREMYERGISRNISVIGITAETDVSSVSEYIYQNNIPFPLLLDKQKQLFAQLGVSATPTKVLCSSDWYVLQVWEGWTTQKSGQSALGGIYAFFGILPDKLPVGP